jgi:hypothetical protein
VSLLELAWPVLSCCLLLSACANRSAAQAPARVQDSNQIVTQAVRTELAADAADHSLWICYDVDRKPDSNVEQWVAQTRAGTLHRVLERDGHTLSKADQQNAMESFIHDSSAQAKQRKGDRHDDDQATRMLSLLPKAFLWSVTGNQNGRTTLHFKPDPNFHPPTWESRVFAAMEGDMVVDNAQHRIASLKGHLIHDVKFAGGFLGELKAGGTFDAERHELSKGVWQITETHVHIEGHALLFKSISEDEDDEKSKFTQLPEDISFGAAETQLLRQNE